MHFLLFILLSLPAIGQEMLLMSGVATVPVAGPASSYPQAAYLIGYWKLDETGTLDRVDSKNSFDLDAVGDLGAQAGLISNAVTNSGTSGRFLVYSNGVALSVTNQSFSVAGWVKMRATNNTIVLVDIYTNSAALDGSQWKLQFQPPPTGFMMSVRNGNNTADGTVSTNLGATYQWFFLAGGWDQPSSNVWLQVDAGVRLQASIDCNQIAADVGTPFLLGANTLAGGNTLNGWLDEVGLWRGVTLTSNEVYTLYNGGLGMTYP